MSNMMEIACRGMGTEVNTFRVYSLEVNDDGELVGDVANGGTVVIDPANFMGVVTTLTF